MGDWKIEASPLKFSKVYVISFKMKKIVRTRDYKFVAIIKPADEGGYYAHCPLLPGCATQGETYRLFLLVILSNFS